MDDLGGTTCTIYDRNGNQKEGNKNINLNDKQNDKHDLVWSFPVSIQLCI